MNVNTGEYFDCKKLFLLYYFLDNNFFLIFLLFIYFLCLYVPLDKFFLRLLLFSGWQTITPIYLNSRTYSTLSSIYTDRFLMPKTLCFAQFSWFTCWSTSAILFAGVVFYTQFSCIWHHSFTLSSGSTENRKKVTWFKHICTKFAPMYLATIYLSRFL